MFRSCIILSASWVSCSCTEANGKMQCSNKKVNTVLRAYACPFPRVRAKSRVMTPLSSINGTRLSIRTGFVKNMSMPDPIASRCNSVCATPVRATILTRLSVSDFLSNSRMRLADSMPSMTGMEISENGQLRAKIQCSIV